MRRKIRPVTAAATRCAGENLEKRLFSFFFNFQVCVSEYVSAIRNFAAAFFKSLCLASKACSFYFSVANGGIQSDYRELNMKKKLYKHNREYKFTNKPFFGTEKDKAKMIKTHRLASWSQLLFKKSLVQLAGRLYTYTRSAWIYIQRILGPAASDRSVISRPSAWTNDASSLLRKLYSSLPS